MKYMMTCLLQLLKFCNQRIQPRLKLDTCVFKKDVGIVLFYCRDDLKEAEAMCTY